MLKLSGENAEQSSGCCWVSVSPRRGQSPAGLSTLCAMALLRAVLGHGWGGLCLWELLCQAQPSPAVCNTGSVPSCGCSVALSCGSVLGLANVFFLLVTLTGRQACGSSQSLRATGGGDRWMWVTSAEPREGLWEGVPLFSSSLAPWMVVPSC